MKTMKKFWKYFLNFIVLFLLVTGLTYWGTSIYNKKEEEKNTPTQYIAQESSPAIEIKDCTNKKIIGTATNDQTGKITYPTINYTETDVREHTYTIKETSQNTSSVTVDTNTYTVKSLILSSITRNMFVFVLEVIRIVQLQWHKGESKNCQKIEFT